VTPEALPGQLKEAKNHSEFSCRDKAAGGPVVDRQADGGLQRGGLSWGPRDVELLGSYQVSFEWSDQEFLLIDIN
jgi:hypothetical protein